MGAKLFDLGFQRFQAGTHLGTAAALLLAIACLLGLILLLGGFRLFGSIAVMQLLEVLVESRLAIFQVQDRAAEGLHQVAVMGDQQQGARVGRQRIGQRFAHEDIQVVGGFVQKHQVRAFQGQLRKAQAGHLTAGKGGAVLEHFLAAVSEPGQVAAHFQLGKAGVLVPDGINDTPGAVCLLLGKDARLGARTQPHHTAAGAALAVQHLQQRGFARAVGTGNDQLVPAVYDIVQRVQQGALPDADGQVFHNDQLVIRLDVVGKAEVQLPRLADRGFDDFQLFQLLAAALRHLSGRGAHKVAVHIILQLGGLFHGGIVQLLLALVGGLALGQIRRVVAAVGQHGLAAQLPDAGADGVQKIAVVADHQHRAAVAAQVGFQPCHGF